MYPFAFLGQVVAPPLCLLSSSFDERPIGLICKVCALALRADLSPSGRMTTPLGVGRERHLRHLVVAPLRSPRAGEERLEVDRGTASSNDLLARPVASMARNP